MDKVVSPITLQDNVKLVTTIPVELIKKKYLQDLKIDVSRFFKTNTISIYQCNDTGFKFYYPFNVDGDDKLYEDLQKIDWYYRHWNWENDTVYSLIQPNSKVLEVGCGTGTFLKKLKENNIEATGLELNKEAVHVCNSFGLQVHHQLLDVHLQQYAGQYDLVCSFQVLEHVANPSVYIQECIDAVKPGGKVIFAVPNNNPYMFKRDKYHTLNMPPHHTGLWSVKAFKSLSQYFKITEDKILVEALTNKRYYFRLLLKSYKIPFADFITDKIPRPILIFIAKMGNWQGRNIVAIYNKI